jgi:hypothetical protein
MLTTLNFNHMKKLLLLLGTTCMLGAYQVQAQTARVMAIHNSAAPALDTVDVWLVNGSTSEKIIDNFGFRQSSGFINAPAGTDIRLAFAAKTSTAITDTLIGFGYNLTANATYVLLAQGTFGTGFNPSQPFGIKVITPVERITGSDSTYLSIVHGSTDAPGVDLGVRKGSDEITTISDLIYGEDVTGAVLPTDDYFIDVFVSSNGTLLQTLNVPLATLGLTDSAVVVFASGFLDPAANNNGKPFGIFAALSNGDVIEVPLQTTFRLQVFHNCADVAADSVDIWLINNTTNTNTKLLSNFAFRTATPYINAPAAQDISIGVAPAGSNTVADVIYTEEINEVQGGITAFAIATGVLDTTKFEPNPGALDISFSIAGTIGAEKSTTSGKVALNVFHGATDAPAVDVKVAGGPTLFSDISFGSSADEYIEVDPQSYTINITPAGSSDIVVAYTAPLTGYADSALMIVASGFLSPNVPTGRDAGAAFGLFAVTPSGGVIELPLATGLRKLNSNVSASLFPNPASNQVSISATESINSIVISDLSGRMIYTNNYETNSNKQVDVNVNEFNKGMYIISVTTNKGTATQKLVVE